MKMGREKHDAQRWGEVGKGENGDYENIIKTAWTGKYFDTVFNTAWGYMYSTSRRTLLLVSLFYFRQTNLSFLGLDLRTAATVSCVYWWAACFAVFFFVVYEFNLNICTIK